MDPFRNTALQSAKLQSLLSSSSSRQDQTSVSDMPAPPAYHMVVDPSAPIPNNQNPYDHDEGEEEKDDEDVDTPEITINAATQVRGHGNIISIAQMDTVRIAHLIASMLNGEPATLPPSPLDKLADVAAAACPQPTTSTTTPSSPTPSFTSTPPPPHQQSSQIHLKPTPSLRKLNITVNCGATIIGDRNIVGPGLGDIARQMQVAQRNQALQAQQQRAAQQQTGAAGLKTPLAGAGVGGLGGLGLGAQRRDTLYQAQAAIAQHHGMMYQAQVHTPPMSRSASEKSDEVGCGGGKRKREEDGSECCGKRQC
ncbi:hypothetical protein T440DRAFT_463747 [Plenodomus tracheiphilus IPT5]|uniref:Uncharacterized protein n=1 Tax=Plenodomus tracheiphilus IPT5 TaxID=1408161 RepID=A0A6A7BM52_9PLEO|nr:hypothetical protein T440DRAFT_463747 [Plenodomus tracheiphilus IPT5]